MRKINLQFKTLSIIIIFLNNLICLNKSIRAVQTNDCFEFKCTKINSNQDKQKMKNKYV